MTVAPGFLGLEHPFKGNRMMLGGVAPHNEDSVCVFDVDPMVGHCAASERLSQSRYRGAVSDSRLVVHVDHAEPRGASGAKERIPRCPSARCRVGRCFPRRLTCCPLPFVTMKSLSRVSLISPGDAVQNEIPVLFLPSVAFRGPVEGLLKSARVIVHGQEGRALAQSDPSLTG